MVLLIIKTARFKLVLHVKYFNFTESKIFEVVITVLFKELEKAIVYIIYKIFSELFLIIYIESKIFMLICTF